MFVILFLAQIPGLIVGTSIIPPLALRTSNNGTNNSSMATSTMYFHQYHEQDSVDNNSTMPTKELNLTSSETRDHYNKYDPWSSLDHLEDPGFSNERGGHYPPIPIDIVQNNQRNDEAQPEDEVDDDDDDDIDSDEEHNRQRRQDDDNREQGDGTVTENYNNQNAQMIIDEIDGDINRQEQDGSDGAIGSDFDIPWNSDDEGEFDQENSASFNIPKVETLKGCKTVYKEIKTSIPNKVSSNMGKNNDFENDDSFRRRKRSVESNLDDDAGTNRRGSYIITRECHFTDGNKKKPAKPGSKTDESRFVPINAEIPDSRSNSYRAKQSAHQFHDFPYPHHHIYYNRNAKPVLNDDTRRYDDRLVGARRGRRANPFPAPINNNMYHYRHPTTPSPKHNINSKRYSTAFNYFHQAKKPEKMEQDTGRLEFSRGNYNNDPNRNGADNDNNDDDDDNNDQPYSNAGLFGTSSTSDPDDLLLHDTNELRTKKERLLANDDGFGGYDEGPDDAGGGGNDDGDDYSVSYGGGNFDAYENSYDSNNKDHDDHGGGHGDDYSSGGGDYDGEGGDGGQSSDYYSD